MQPLRPKHHGGESSEAVASLGFPMLKGLESSPGSPRGLVLISWTESEPWDQGQFGNVRGDVRPLARRLSQFSVATTEHLRSDEGKHFILTHFPQRQEAQDQMAHLTWVSCSIIT